MMLNTKDNKKSLKLFFTLIKNYDKILIKEVIK